MQNSRVGLIKIHFLFTSIITKELQRSLKNYNNYYEKLMFIILIKILVKITAVNLAAHWQKSNIPTEKSKKY